MIKVYANGININGNLSVIMAEFSMLTRELYFDILQEKCGYKPEKAREMLENAFEEGLLSKEELHEKGKEALGKLLSAGKLPDFMKFIIEELINGHESE